MSAEAGPPAPDWAADAAIWMHLTGPERLLLNRARGLQGGDPGQPVGIEPLARAVGRGKRWVKGRVDSLAARDLWPVPLCRRGGWRGPSRLGPLSNFDLAARIQMAQRRKARDGMDTDWRWREANRLQAARHRAAVVRRREAVS